MIKYLTEYKNKEDWHMYGDFVFGNTLEEAQLNADLLNLGKVVGEHILTIPCNPWDDPDDILDGLINNGGK